MVTSSVFILLGLGIVAAAVLGIASKILQVREDPRISAVEKCFPGANCGGCGYPGCAAAAAAIVAGDAPPEICVAGGMEIAENVAGVMDLAVQFKEPKLAAMLCTGGTRANRMYNYEGIKDCRAAAMYYGGAKSCGLGCMGMGSCVTACSFNAIRLGPDHLPMVNPVLCRSCGRCAEVCPTNAIYISGMTSELLHFNQGTDCLAPCMQKCPAQIDVRRYVQHLKNNNMQDALLTIKERNPLPLSVGRCCPHPCESICRRNIADKGVAIATLQRYVADWEMNSGSRVGIDCNPDTGHKIAIIGGGPAGLTCAYFLRRAGHHPVIFDALPKLGGMLRHAIPEYRLPRRVVDWEVQGILALGIEARTNVRFGKDFDLKSLEEDGFEAVFVAIGAWKVPLPEIKNEDAPGVVDSLAFLTGVESKYQNLEGKKIVVLGDTNTAMDVARSAVRLKAREVTVLSPVIQKKMSANKKEIKKALELSAKILFLTRPTRVIIDDVGKACGIEYIETAYKDPKKALGEPEPLPGTLTIIDANLIIIAHDRKPDLSSFADKDGNSRLTISGKHTLDADKETLQTSIPHVFAGGEVHTGRSVIIQAVADGRRAARSIHYFVEQGAIPAMENPVTKLISESIIKNVNLAYTIPRVQVPAISVAERKLTFKEEVSESISHVLARKEAARCLRCGLTCYDPDAGWEYARDIDVEQNNK